MIEATLDEVALWASALPPQEEAGWTKVGDRCPLYWYFRHARGLDVRTVGNHFVRMRGDESYSLPAHLKVVVDRIEGFGESSPMDATPRRVTFGDLLAAIRYARGAKESYENANEAERSK